MWEDERIVTFLNCVTGPVTQLMHVTTCNFLAVRSRKALEHVGRSGYYWNAICTKMNNQVVPFYPEPCAQVDLWNAPVHLYLRLSIFSGLSVCGRHEVLRTVMC